MADEAPARIGRYELVGLLGRGAMGEVHEAVLHGPVGFRKRVALKLLREGPDGDAATQDALMREARLGALLSHPNVVGTWELGEADGRWFVAMELVQGGSVAELLGAGPLPPPAAVDLAIQVCAGLAHIHGLRVDGRAVGLVHRDIKPANLLVDRAGLVKVADLGIARLQGGTDRQVVGTPGFMAPEQTEGDAEARSDLFALGIVLVMLLTGELPVGTGADAVIRVHRIESILRSGPLLASIGAMAPGLDTIVARCLRRRPRDRFGSAGELAEALRAVRAALDGGPSLPDLLVERLVDARGDELVTPSRGRATPQPDTTWVLDDGLPPTNVRDRTERLIGRDEELARLAAALPDHAVLTLHGTAGVGKTRLARAVAVAARRDFLGGTWWVRCTEARTEQGLCAAVGEALDRPVRGDDPVGQLGQHLRRQGGVLVVLDNVEQLVDVAAATLARWAAGAPQARFLATSRVPLRLPDEHVVEVLPLTPEAALALFEARCPVRLAPEARPDAERLVERLDRLPLAIELAAARARLLPPAALLERLDDRFRLLAGQGRGRHASLRAALDASWDLLTPWERDAAAQLSVFADGFDVETAEAVLSLQGDAPWTLDVLAALLDHSLLQHDRDAQRFGMLTSIQAYAAEHLDPEARRAAEVRHGEAFARVADRSQPDYRRWNTERENLTVAVFRAVDRGDVEVACDVGRTLSHLLCWQGPVPSALRVCDAVLSLPDLGDHRPALLGSRGSTLRHLGRFSEAMAQLTEVVRLARAAGQTEVEGNAQVSLGNTYRESGDLVAAREHLEAAIALGERGWPDIAARAHGDLGIVYRAESKLAEAEACYLRALEHHRRAGRADRAANLHNNLGNVAANRGDLAAARQHYLRAIELSKTLGEATNRLNVLLNLANLDHREGHFDEAVRRYRRAIPLALKTGNPIMEVAIRTSLAGTLIEAGHLDEGEAENDLVLARTATMEPTEWHALPLANAAGLARSRDDFETAERRYREAIEVEEQHGDARTVHRLRSWLADLRRERGDLAGALTMLDRFVAWTEEVGDVEAGLEAHALRAGARQAAGDLAGAQRDVDAAHARQPGGLLRVRVELVRALLAHARGDAETAHLALDRARLGADAMQVRPGSVTGRLLAEAEHQLGTEAEWRLRKDRGQDP